eukprot:CAMPEP_0179006010 /NCGR_PEP_ID=MMETSP0795-20121207/14292_1 /TAXON_ID=88552 /ORGANISM="Amoebophrya sp., Strain Ameob2" /LENGTH=152 /DNA_ID=CAMNT_0020700675 /DNA_START=134 /DNA_END=588 /DNA_ORIENTATION=+
MSTTGEKKTSIPSKCTGADTFFVRHCVIAEFMEAGLGRVGDEHEGQGEVQAAGVKENDVVVAVDADVAARGLRPSLAYYLEKLIQGADLMFFERIWGWERHNEIMAGSYMVRNTNKSRRFLYQWADVELRKPPGFHSADNGAIHLHLMEASG